MAFAVYKLKLAAVSAQHRQYRNNIIAMKIGNTCPDKNDKMKFNLKTHLIAIIKIHSSINLFCRRVSRDRVFHAINVSYAVK